MASRRFFYDDCRSTDRRTRDYSVDLAHFTMALGGYDSTIKRNYCRFTKDMAGTQYEWLYLLPIQFNRYEISFIHRCDKVAPNANGLSIFLNAGLGGGRGFVQITNDIYILRAAFDYFAVPAGFIPYTENIWQNVKFRDDGMSWRYKRWNFNDSEPNWQIAAPYISTPGQVAQLRTPGSVGVGAYTDNTAVVHHDIADIRITPVRRAGP